MSVPKSDNNGWPEFKRLIEHQLKTLEKQHVSFAGKLDGVQRDFSKQIADAKEEILEKVNSLELKYARIDTKMKMTLGIYTAIGSAFFSIIINLILQSFNS